MDKFFLNEEPLEKKKEREFKEILSECVKNKTMSLLEHSYFLDYWESGGTIVNSNWLIEIVNRQNNEKLCRSIKEHFSNIYKKLKGKNEIKLISSHLGKDIVENKKDTIEFTKDQKKIINEIFDFLPDFNKRSYGAYGYAGTGKTTTIVEILSFLLITKMIKSVAFTAPTNQAVDVIKSRFRPYLKEIYNAYSSKELDQNFNFDDVTERMYEFKVKIDFITIHKLLKFEREYDLDGITFVKNKAGSLISSYEVVIIDECSMIPVTLAEHIFNELRLAVKKDSSSYKKVPKVIFLGDKAQLPPVGETVSVIFAKSNKDLSLDEFKKLVLDSNENDNDTNINQQNDTMDACVNTFKDLKKDQMTVRYDMLMADVLSMPNRTLKKVMRSKLPEVTDVCYQIRLWTLGEVKEPKLAEYIKGGVKAYRFIKGNSKLKSQWFEKCLDQHKNGKNYNIILTWTNNQADEYNKAIRNTLFRNSGGKIDRFMEGDILMLNKFYNMDDGNVSYVGEESNDKKFYTSEQIKVVKVEQVIKSIPNFVVNLSKKAQKVANINHYETKLKQSVDKINKSTKRNYLCWKLTVTKNKDLNHSKKTELNVIFVIHEKYEKLYETDKTLAQYEIRNLSSSLLTKFKDKASAIDTHIIKPLTKDYYTKMEEPFANVSYGYAITCHKAQGSNFYNTFVDVDDILKNIKQSESKHCFYTAVTRTSNEMHLLIGT